jgi:hypothetical protein
MNDPEPEKLLSLSEENKSDDDITGNNVLGSILPTCLQKPFT